MKKEFYALMGYNGKKTLEKREGDYDSTLGVFYSKTKDGWCATDEYTGTSLIVAKTTKKECQEALKTILPKVKELRNGEKYLQGVINYREMLED